MANDDDTPLEWRARLAGIAEQGTGWVIAILFWIIVTLIAVVATAQSGKPWDTLIAALAMASQAFFAFMVWRLGQAQYAFTQRITDRQHKIDAYPLRKEAVQELAVAFSDIRPGNFTVPDKAVSNIRACYVEIARLFSDTAAERAKEIYEALNRARKEVHTVHIDLPDAIVRRSYDRTELTEQGKATVWSARIMYAELVTVLESEMRIR